MKEQYYNSRIWEIGTLVKLVAGKDVNAITKIAKHLCESFDSDELDEVDNRIIYDSYCELSKEEEST